MITTRQHYEGFRMIDIGVGDGYLGFVDTGNIYVLHHYQSTSDGALEYILGECVKLSRHPFDKPVCFMFSNNYVMVRTLHADAITNIHVSSIKFSDADMVERVCEGMENVTCSWEILHVTKPESYE